MDNGDSSGASSGEAGDLVARSLSQLLSVMSQATGRGYDALEATPASEMSIGQRQVVDALNAILDQDDERFVRSFPDVDNQTLDDLGKLIEKLNLDEGRRSTLAEAVLRPSETLVSEVDGDEYQVVEDEEPSGGRPSPSSQLSAVLEALSDSPIAAEVGKRGLELSLPAGRDKREILVWEESAPILAGDQYLGSWRSLVRYDGVWNPEWRAIEVAIRPERASMPARHVIRRLLGKPPGIAFDDFGDDQQVEVSHSADGIRVLFGFSNTSAAQLLDSRRRPGLRPALTVRFENVDAATTADADDLVHRLGSSLLFDLEVQFRLSLSLGRLETATRPRLPKRPRPDALRFPTNEYPHAPLVLFRLGRNRSLPSIVRYWCLYQVLEYFYPRYANQKALERLARQVRSPAFDAHRREDLLETLSIAGSVANYNERQLLATTLEAITTPDEIRRLVAELGIEEALRARGESQLSSHLVDVKHVDMLVQLAHRIYDVRNRIVHSKVDSRDDRSDTLLPGTEHDDLVEPELGLMDYLAQEAIVAAAEPLRLPGKQL